MSIFSQYVSTCDLCIVIGTSLTVQPFARLPSYVSAHIPRLLINREPVGPFTSVSKGLDRESNVARLLAGVSIVDDESRPMDMFHQGDADAGVRQLAEELGWTEELDEMIRKGHKDLEQLWEERKKIAGEGEMEDDGGADGGNEEPAVARAQSAAKSVQAVVESEKSDGKIPLDEVQAMQKLNHVDLRARKDVAQ